MSMTTSHRPPILDERDQAILDARQEALYEIEHAISGDWVDFADGVVRRISHVWDPPPPYRNWIQTSDAGSWYLGEGYVSFSGGLFTGVPAESLTDTGTFRRASVWFFHHDHWGAHRGVSGTVEQRVWHCNLPATNP